MTPHPILESDLSTIREIYEKFYKEQFAFPDFKRNFPTLFKIVNGSGDIITTGGIKLFPEMILITDKEAEPRDRYDALKQALAICQFHARSMGYDTLHASAGNDDIWEQILKKIGFVDSKDNNLVIR